MITALFRLEGGPQIGLGHAMRCLTLADQLGVYNVQSVFVTANSNLTELFSKRGYKNICLSIRNRTEIDDAKETVEAIKSLAAQLVVVDHYGLGQAWEGHVRNQVDALIVIDDLIDKPHDCHIISNSNPIAIRQDYQKFISENTLSLLGREYILLNKNFIKYRHQAELARSYLNPVRRILVSMGATDPQKYSLMVLGILEDLTFDGHIDLVITSSCEWIKKTKFKHTYPFTLAVHTDVENMAELILSAELAFGSIGGSSWERCFLGLPSVVMVSADNQLSIASFLSENKLAYVTHPESIHELVRSIFNNEHTLMLREISKRGFSQLDGKGALRLSKAMLLTGLKIEKFTLADSDALFAWQNEAGARIYSRNPNPPTWEEHDQWISNKLQDKNVRMWAIKIFDMSVGYIRLDKLEAQEEVSILISSRFRGLSLGKLAIQFINKQAIFQRVLAYVQPDNIASISLFLSCGYVQQDAQHLIWIKESL